MQIKITNYKHKHQTLRKV